MVLLTFPNAGACTCVRGVELDWDDGIAAAGAGAGAGVAATGMMRDYCSPAWVQLLTLCPRTQDSQAHFSPSIIMLGGRCVLATAETCQVWFIIAAGRSEGSRFEQSEKSWMLRGRDSQLVWCERGAGGCGGPRAGRCRSVGREMTMTARRGSKGRGPGDWVVNRKR